MRLFSRRKSLTSNSKELNIDDFVCGTAQVEYERRMLWEKKMRLLLDAGLVSNEEFEEALRTKFLSGDFKRSE